jgi:hypothetical protein
MSLFSLGKVTVTTPGTPVPLSATSISVNALYFQALSGNTGVLYVGKQSMVRATLVGVFRTIAAPTAATPAIILPDWNLVSSVFTAPFDISQIFLDADVGTNGLLVSYVA